MVQLAVTGLDWCFFFIVDFDDKFWQEMKKKFDIFFILTTTLNNIHHIYLNNIHHIYVLIMFLFYFLGQKNVFFFFNKKITSYFMHFQIKSLILLTSHIKHNIKIGYLHEIVQHILYSRCPILSKRLFDSTNNQCEFLALQ